MATMTRKQLIKAIEEQYAKFLGIPIRDGIYGINNKPKAELEVMLTRMKTAARIRVRAERMRNELNEVDRLFNVPYAITLLLYYSDELYYHKNKPEAKVIAYQRAESYKR